MAKTIKNFEMKIWPQDWVKANVPTVIKAIAQDMRVIEDFRKASG
jgi:hypothetical protein